MKPTGVQHNSERHVRLIPVGISKGSVLVFALLAPFVWASDNLPMVALGPDDLIQVTIYGNPELSRTIRVAADGTIRMPMLEDAIRASGKLPSELEPAIAAAFRREQVLVDPIISVTVSEYVSRHVSIGGAVRNPTTVQALGNMRLAEAITRAGGLNGDAGPGILVR